MCIAIPKDGYDSMKADRSHASTMQMEETTMKQECRPVHELILEVLSLASEPVSREQLLKLFPEFSEAFDKIMALERDIGRIECIERNGKVFYKITKIGEERVKYRFSSIHRRASPIF